MDNIEYKELITKLNGVLGVKPPIPGVLSKNMDFEQLSDDELGLVHNNLHRFYPTGIKDITKSDIERLHKEIKNKIKHDKAFDMLDRI